jgi:hypothetical protein
VAMGWRAHRTARSGATECRIMAMSVWPWMRFLAVRRCCCVSIAQDARRGEVVNIKEEVNGGRWSGPIIT